MMNCKRFYRKQSWPNFKALSWHSLGGTEEKTAKNLNQYRRSSGPRIEPWTFRIRRSVNHSTTTFGITVDYSSHNM
jgi:hypothetical protein